MDNKILLAAAAIGGAYWFLHGRKRRNPEFKHGRRKSSPSISKRAPTLMRARLDQGANRLKEDRVLREWDNAEQAFGSSSPQANRLRQAWYQLEKLDFDKSNRTITAYEAYRKRYGKYPDHFRA